MTLEPWKLTDYFDQNVQQQFIYASLSYENNFAVFYNLHMASTVAYLQTQRLTPWCSSRQRWQIHARDRGEDGRPVCATGTIAPARG